jgi:hypothetical protein
MDAVAFPLVSKRNQLNFQFVPLMINSVVWEERPHAESEGWTQLSTSSLSYGTTERLAQSGTKHFHQTGQLLGATISDPEKTGSRAICENSEVYDHYRIFRQISLRRDHSAWNARGLINKLHGTQRTALAAALIDVAICHHHLWEMRVPFVLAVHQAPTDGLGEKDIGGRGRATQTKTPHCAEKNLS